MSDNHSHDNRRVALIKSLYTNNRFYALVTNDSGIKNADTVEQIPQDVMLGIAYPCLEDGLNDFAVIRTTFETLEYFPDDEAMKAELMQIITEAREKLVKRLAELRERISAKRAHFLGTDLEEFKSYVVDIVTRGYPRKNLDSMMKLNVFGSVADVEGANSGPEPLYKYEFRTQSEFETFRQLPPREFIAALFGDVLDSVTDDRNYTIKYLFDRNVFQKFIAVMFVNYATTDPIFYGINRADYGVSGDKEMDETPLYMAVKKELLDIEAHLALEDGIEFRYQPGGRIETTETGQLETASVDLPGTMINEDALLSPIAAICAVAEKIRKKDDREAAEFGRIILAEASRLVNDLKRLNILSPMAYDPGTTLKDE